MVNIMPIEIGKVAKFEVKRETDISYTLSPLDPDLTTYIFLHFNQATRKLTPGEIIEAFLYFDQKKRLCATMEQPLITTTKAGFVEVVGINKAGVFVNIGIAKDILVSSDYLPNNPKAWPAIKDFLPCILKAKTDQLIATIVTNDQYASNKLEINHSYDGTVIKITTDGIVVCTNGLNTVFIHRSLTRKLYRLGEKVNVKVINLNSNNKYNGSLIEQKEIARIDDSKIILKYLQDMGGSIALGNASTPEEISHYFKMSKSAFKRAVGALYKKKLIVVSDYYIKLV